MDVRRLRERLPEPPESFCRAILEGRARIRRWERSRARARRAALLAAALVLALGGAVAGLAGALRPAADRTVAGPVARPSVEILAVPAETGGRAAPVYASFEDEYYHAAANCALCRAEAVSMPPETAREFDKLPCPACLGGIAKEEISNADLEN